MHDTAFDHLTKSMGAGVCRRGMLRALAGGGLTLRLLGWAEVHDAAAKNCKKIKDKKKRRACRKKAKGATAQLPAPAPAPGPVTRVAATCPGPGSGTTTIVSNGNQRLAQTFTAETSGPLVRAELLLAKTTSVADDLVLRLSPVDSAGVPTNDVLAEAAVADATLPIGVSTVSFSFTGTFALVAGTTYALVLSRPGSGEYRSVGHTGDTCAGRVFGSLNQTAAFVPLSSGIDLNFTTFVHS